jgi:hypothetical protein
MTGEKAPRRGPTAVAVQSNCQDDTSASPAREDPDAEYRRRLTDDEVRDLGYSHRDGTGRWVHRRELRRSGPRGPDHRSIGARRCLSCGVDPLDGDHGYWCPDATPSVGTALRDARDLEAAIAWKPKVTLPKLSEPERLQLNKLFTALVRAREQAYPVPRLWTIKEYRDRGTA